MVPGWRPRRPASPIAWQIGRFVKVAEANRGIEAALRELAILTQLEEGSPQAFRVRAYENGITALASLGRDASQMSLAELKAVRGIGEGIAKRIREYAETGSIVRLEDLRKKYPPSFLELTRVPGLGPKKLVELRKLLGIESIGALREAIDNERLRQIPGFGEKTEENLKRAISRLGLGEGRRHPIGEVMPLVDAVVTWLAEIPQVKTILPCGSYRRFSETIGDLDIVVASRQAGPIMDRFINLPEGREVIAKGETKSALITQAGVQVDLRVVTPQEFGAATLYFTGSKAHNINLRQRALANNWTLNEYGLSELEGDRMIAQRTERDIYQALGLELIPPPMREDTGEIEMAAKGSLPRTIHLSDIKGDLHVHTDLSGDGRASLQTMLASARKRGLTYVAITDHGEDLSINGVSRDQLRRQRRQIQQLGKEGMVILQGCELNIGSDGKVDYDPDFLAELDWSVASVHSHFDLERAHQTRRLLAAIANPGVNAIGHLSGRKLGRRPGIEFDLDPVLEAAAATGTAIEINGAIDRLDASAEVVRRGTELGVVFVISTDAHHPTETERMAWGVQLAQRGWATRDHIVNSWPTNKFLRWAKAKRK